MMAYPQEMPKEVREFCDECAAGLGKLTNPRESMEYALSILPGFLKQTDVFARMMAAIGEGKGYPDARRPTLFDNEIVLHIDDQKRFSIRMYLFGPGEYTVIHDHNSWGVIGSPTEGFDVVNYTRQDDGKVEGYAKLVEKERVLLKTAEVSYTLPLNMGIHKTGNALADASILSINLYGRTVPRGYICGYEPERNRVYRLMSPRQKKEALAADSLSLLRNGAPA